MRDCLFVFLFLILYPIYSFYTHHCIHEEIAIKDLIPINSSYTHIDENRRNIHLPRFIPFTFETIRILIDYESNIDIDIEGETEKLEYLKNEIFPASTTWLGHLIEVIPRQDGVSIPFDNTWCGVKHSNGKCKEADLVKCLDFNINIDHYDEVELCPESEDECEIRGGAGGNYDFILYAAGRQDENCESDSVVAYSTACFVDSYDGNPLIGYLNICPDKINPNDNELERNQYIHIIVHEIFHALGFSEAMFKNFLYHDGIPRSTVTKTFEERGETVTKFVTENTINIAQLHFGCSSLNGLELEGGGGINTRIGHTEERIFKNDFMNGHVSETPKFSMISLSIMHDSGWYQAKFENAEPLYWGNGLGCDFAMEKCLTVSLDDEEELPEINGPSQDRHFCNRDGQQGCTSSREAKAICRVEGNNQNIPSNQQYFSDPLMGGRCETMDFCPFFEYNTSCLLSSNMGDDDQYYGEYYGPNSRCIESSVVLLGEQTVTTALPRCYNVTCDYENEEFTIVFYNPSISYPSPQTNITCSKNNENNSDDEEEQAFSMDDVDPENWSGTIECPLYETVCLQNPAYEPVDKKSWMWLTMLLVLGAIAVIVILCLLVCGLVCIFTILCTGAIGDLIKRRILRPMVGDFYVDEMERFQAYFPDYFGVGENQKQVEEIIRHSLFTSMDLSDDDYERSISSSTTTTDNEDNENEEAEEEKEEEDEGEYSDEIKKLDEELISSSSSDSD